MVNWQAKLYKIKSRLKLCTRTFNCTEKIKWTKMIVITELIIENDANFTQIVPRKRRLNLSASNRRINIKKIETLLQLCKMNIHLKQESSPNLGGTDNVLKWQQSWNNITDKKTETSSPCEIGEKKQFYQEMMQPSSSASLSNLSSIFIFRSTTFAARATSTSEKIANLKT